MTIQTRQKARSWTGYSKSCRSNLVIVHHLIRDASRVMKRGAALYDQLNSRSTQQWLTRRREGLGLKVIPEPLDAAG
jgi:hypothetical protein